MKLGVNIDHIAVLREAREINDPNILDSLPPCKIAGADQITIHLREDRRHIKDKDVLDILAHTNLPINLECSLDKDILKFVATHKPHIATLVPENRAEVTTEGGLDIKALQKGIKEAKVLFDKNDIALSVFIDPNTDMIDIVQSLGISNIELHTGRYANIYAMLYGGLANSSDSIAALELPRERLKKLLDKSLKDITASVHLAKFYGMHIAVGHGLNYQNIINILKIKDIDELNIGQSIVARSVFVGLQTAIKQMKDIISKEKI